MRKKGLFAGAVALLAAGTGAQAFEVQQYLGFADGSLDAIRAHMAAVQPDATATADRIDFGDSGEEYGEFAGTRPFPAAGDHTGSDGVNDLFVLRATGGFVTEIPGRFVFKTRSDDGVYLLIDGQTVIADGNFHAPTENWGEIALQPGPHSIELVYFEDNYAAVIELSSERPDGGYDPVIEGGTLSPKYPDDPAAVVSETAAAPAEIEAAAAPEAPAGPEQTVGVWHGVFDMGGQTRTVSLVSTPEAAMLYVNNPYFFGGNERGACNAIFTPADRFAAMQEQGNDCNPTGAPWAIDGLDGEGRLVVHGTYRSDERSYALPFVYGPESQVSTMPDSTLDLAGVTLAPTVGEIMDTISAGFPPAGDPPPRSAFTDPLAEYDAVEEFPGWIAVGADNSGYLIHASPDADANDYREFPENEFVILSREAVYVPGRGLFGREARPWGLVRFWLPAQADVPTVQTLRTALEAKYGTPGWTRTLGGNYGEYIGWGFDPAGNALGPEAAARCGSWVRDAGLLDLFSIEVRGGGNPDLVFPARSGCGIQLIVGHPNFTRPTDQVAPVIFALYDPQSVLVTRWSEKVERLAQDMIYARRSIDESAARRAERDGKQPDL